MRDLHGLLPALVTFVNQSVAIDLIIRLLNICEVHDNRQSGGRAFVVSVNEIALRPVLPSSMT